MAIIKIRNAAIDLDAAEIPNLDASKITTGSLGADRIPGLAASKITSGTFSDARIAASNVSQHATSFDDNKLVNDISTLALRQASDQNKSAYNTNSQSVDVFQDDTGIDTTTNVSRNANEYIDTIQLTVGSLTTLGNSNITVTLVGAGGITNGQDKLFDGNLNPTPGIDGIYLSMGGVNYVSSGQQGLSPSYFIKLAFDQQYKISTVNFYSWATNGRFYDSRFHYSTDDSNYDYWNTTGASGIASGTSSSSSQIGWSNNNGWANHSDSNDTIMQYLKFVPYSGAYNNGNLNAGISEFFVQGYPYSLITNATGNFTGTTITAPSSVSEMGAIITYQDQFGTNALNTDIVLQLSADGGSNYSTATLTALPDFSTGIKMAKVNDLAVTAGTSLKYKISFANQASGTKEARIRGVALQY